MKFIDSNKTGKKCELILLEMLKDNKSKTKYVSKKLDELSTDQNKLLIFKDDVKTLKRFLTINYKSFIGDIKQSSLSITELKFLECSLHTRFMQFIRKNKIPLN